MGALWGGHALAHPEYLGEAQRALADLHWKGEIRLPRPIEYTLDQAPAALRDLANRQVLWKAVLTM